MGDDDPVVFSSDVGRICVACQQPAEACTCGRTPDDDRKQGPVTIRIDRSGRRGKTVTMVEGIVLPHSKLQKLAKVLKRRCGSGGTAQNGVIEIQGDRRATVIAELTDRGYDVQSG